MKLMDAFKAFFGVLSGKIDSQKLLAEESGKKLQEEPIVDDEKTVTVVAKDNKFDDGAVFSLVLLQREGRLIDFLKENIDGFEDGQIGAAVRQIHANCKKVLTENFQVNPIFDSTEGDAVVVQDDFDPSTVKLTGNVPEQAPYKGTLQHKGWIVERVKIPERNAKVNSKVIYPAEVSF